VSFLKRLLGGASEDTGDSHDGPAASSSEIFADEQAHELEMLKQEAGRLDDLQQRQLRYADKAWTPPAQGGDRRADDEGNAGEA
jgi:hypothetical protein